MSQIKYYLKRIVPPVVSEWYEKNKIKRSYITALEQLNNADKLHLACGTNILKGWKNLDFFEHPEVVFCDLTKKFPVADNSVKYIFCEHFIEHINLNQGYDFLKNCHNVLNDSGSIRIATPNLNKVVQCYLQKNLKEWDDVGFLPETPCQLLKDSLKLWGHQFVYDEAELRSVMLKAGFKNVRRMNWHQSEIKEFVGLECRPYHDDLIFEADK